MPATVLVYSGAELVGDGLIKLPFARALRRAFPHARITWLAGKGASVYAHALAPAVAELIDEVIEDAGIGSRAAELFRRPLPDRCFDLVIDTQRRVLTTLIVKRIRHRVFVSGCADSWFSDAKPAGRYVKSPAMIRQLLNLIEAATGTTVEAGPPLEPEPEGSFGVLARRLLPDEPVYVGIAPGAGGREKCWPLENFIELARDLAERGRVPVFLLGPDEASWIEDLRGAAPESLFPLQDPRLEDEQHYSPMLTIALAGRLAVAVANDSGAGHMIAAADAPMVSLFGPTSAEKFAPITSKLIVITAQAHGADHMAAIPVAAVMDAVEGILSEPAR